MPRVPANLKQLYADMWGEPKIFCDRTGGCFRKPGFKWQTLAQGRQHASQAPDARAAQQP